MSTTDFNELAGRIEGVGRAVMLLAAMLEEADFIDGSQFANALRVQLRPTSQSVLHLATARKTLLEMADVLDAARNWRQESGRQQ